MKKLACFVLLAGLVLNAARQEAAAVEVKTSGEWDFNFEWSEMTFRKDRSDDVFHARQRLRTQVEIVASESLSGVVFFEIGDTNWGNASEGASIGTDGVTVEVRYSYVDWVIPNTDVKVRMGLQPISLPGFVAGSPVLDADAAGVVLSWQFNDTAGVSLFWMRGEHDNAHDDNGVIDRGLGSNMDFFGLSVPLTGDGWALNPWGVYANLGRNSLIDPSEAGEYGDVVVGMLPYGVTGDYGQYLKDTNNPGWWVGLGGEVTAFAPFRFALDAAYGKADWGKLSGERLGLANAERDVDLTREGWLAVAALEYKLDIMTPGLIFWYGSGDDDNPYNGSERMPTIKPAWAATSFGWDGAYGIADNDAMGLSPVGTWGVIAQLKDISFMEDLSHTLAFGYYTGTNDESLVQNERYRFASAYAGNPFGSSLDGNPLYLTRKDHAWEVDFNTEYKLYENLTLVVELGYIRLDLDKGVWSSVIAMDDVKKNAYKAGLNLNYAF